MKTSKRKEELLRISAKLFKVHGYHGTSMQNIADACGLEKASLYHHFTGKETLVYEIISTALASAIDKLDGVLNDKAITSSASRLRSATISLVNDICGELDASVAFTVMTDGEILSPPLREQYVALRDDFEKRFRSIIDEGIDNGEFQQQRETSVVTKGILGMIAWVPMWYRPTGELTSAQVGEELAELAVGALRGPG